jgi:hypothetical protein
VRFLSKLGTPKPVLTQYMRQLIQTMVKSAKYLLALNSRQQRSFLTQDGVRGTITWLAKEGDTLWLANRATLRGWLKRASPTISRFFRQSTVLHFSKQLK